MKPTIQKISEEFSKGNSDFAKDFMADDVVWNLVGDKMLKGKDNVLELCNQVGAEGFTPFENNLTITENNHVTVTGKSVTNDNFYCDIYKFKEGKIQEITSYYIKTSII